MIVSPDRLAPTALNNKDASMSRIPFLLLRWPLLLLAAALPLPLRGAAVDDLVAQIQSVRGEGFGSAEAAQAWKKLVDFGPDAMPAILAGMDDHNTIAANWLRTAVDAIGEKALKEGKSLPAAKLETFVAAKTNPAGARRLAYEWLVRADKTAPARLLSGMLHDPSAELRRDAVAVVIKEGEDKLDKKDKDGAKAAFQKALTGACDEDQVKALAAHLKELGVTVDLAAHYGFVRHWHLLTPFDNTGAAGFNKVYPPENGVDLKAAYKGKGGAEARWQPYTSDDPHGKVDLNVILGKKKGTIAYAYAVIDAPEERTVQLRIGTFNALKMFVNGKLVYAHDEYHHGMRIDQYNPTAALKKGRNELLLKICQNEQSEDWAQSWIFQIRICDTAGAAVPVKVQEVKP
jgi:hypothetical protein